MRRGRWAAYCASAFTGGLARASPAPPTPGGWLSGWSAPASASVLGSLCWSWGRTGLERAAFRRCVLAAGCRERTVHSLPMAGTRPKGVYTAGQAQRLTNLGHYDIGDDIVILGSGDVGQIMARQLVQAGKRVTAVIEQRSALGGLARNRRACIEAYRIPVLLRSTVDEILGEDRIQGVMVRNLETGMRDRLACGALVTALGLIPDRTLAGSGGAPEWLRLCGNCDYVHDMVDRVVREAASLGAELGEESAREGYI